jgi:hypothetical protein
MEQVSRRTLPTPAPKWTFDVMRFLDLGDGGQGENLPFPLLQNMPDKIILM